MEEKGCGGRDALLLSRELEREHKGVCVELEPMLSPADRDAGNQF